MYCKKCGLQNIDGAKYCAGCGEKLENVPEVNENNFDTSIIRKAIKLKAKNSSKSSLVITLVFAILLAFLGIFVIASNVAVGILYFLLYMILWLFIFFGIVKGSLSISRGENIEFMNVIKNSFKKPSWCLKYILGAILFSLVLSILMLIPVVGLIIGLVVEIYFIPVLVMYMYKCADSNVQDKSISGMINSSMKLIKGHRVEFYGLLISFFGWILLGIITLGIALIWVIPYINVSLANFYRYLNGEEQYTDAEKGLSNTAIIALGIAGYLIFIIAIVITIITFVITGVIDEKDINKDNTYDYQWNLNNDNQDKDHSDVNIINMEGVNVAVPSDYTKTSVGGFDVSYMSEDGTALIATKKISASNIDLDTYSQQFKEILTSTSYTCGDIETNTNGNNWNKLVCDYTGGTKLYNYIATDSDNVYLVTVTAYNSISDKGESIAEDVENNLSFAK